MNKNSQTPILDFIEENYHHFNAMQIKRALHAWIEHINKGGKMFVTLGGAMSSARLGITLAPLIRAGLVHGISCTGANLEESAFQLIAHSKYKKYPDYRYFTKEDDQKILDEGGRRVTDMGIPEEDAFRVLEPLIEKLWIDAHEKGERYYPHEYFYKLLLSGDLENYYDGKPEECWLLAAAEKNLPIIVGGPADSTMGNIFSSKLKKGIVSHMIMKSDFEAMSDFQDTYKSLSSCPNGLGFFQIAGGISGDFPICVVPHLISDMEEIDTKPWAYFCQISDSTTSYGSYSGATPNEKITWLKLTPETPMFVIESDATAIAPLIFKALLEINDLARSDKWEFPNRKLEMAPHEMD